MSVRRRLVNRIMTGIVFLIIWQFSSILLHRSFFPDAVTTVRSFMHLICSGSYWEHMAASAFRILTGTLIGLTASVAAGLSMGTIPRMERIFGGFFALLYPVPKVIFLPIIIVAMGLGDGPKIFLIALVLFFQLTVIITDTAKLIPKEQIDTLRSLQASHVQMIWHLYLPGCLPGIMTALRSSLGISMSLLFISETFASSSGLGYFISISMDMREYPQMYAGILGMMLLGILLYGLIGLCDRYLCRWNRSSI